MKFVTTLIAAASVVAVASVAQAAESYRIGGGPAGGDEIGMHSVIP